MAKRKNSMALFEVVAGDGKGHSPPDLSVPDWMRSGHGGEQEPDGQAAPTDQTPPAEAVGSAQAPAAAVAAPRRDVPVEPIVSTTGGRLTVSLNYISCTVTLLAILLLVIVAFMIGRASSRPSQTPAIKKAAVTNDGGSQRTAAGGSPSRAANLRTPGKYYLVIQEMRGISPALKADAEAIVAYLADYPATVERIGNQWVVWSLDGFGSPDSLQAGQYAAEINAKGIRYKNSHPTKPYAFNERNRNGRPKFARHVRPGRPD